MAHTRPFLDPGHSRRRTINTGGTAAHKFKINNSTYTENLTGSEIPRDPYRVQCRTRGVLDRMGDRWTILTDLLYATEGNPQKMLTKPPRSRT